MRLITHVGTGAKTARMYRMSARSPLSALAGPQNGVGPEPLEFLGSRRHARPSQFVAANLAPTGIKLQVRPLERGTLMQVRTQPAIMLRYNGIDSPHAAQYAAPTPAERLRNIRQIQQSLAADVSTIVLYQRVNAWLVNPRVHNFVSAVLFNGDPLSQVTLIP